MRFLQSGVMLAVVWIGSACGARAADAANPYGNIDPRVDAGNATGDEQVERLNEGQLGGAGDYREDGWWHGGPTAAPPPGGWWARGEARAPVVARRRMYVAPPGYYGGPPGYGGPGYYGPPPGSYGAPPGYYAAPPSVSID